MRRTPLAVSAVAAAALTAALATTPAYAAPGPIDLITPLQGYADFWTPASDGSLDGTVVDSDIARAVLARNDEIVTWINNNATEEQQFDALQASLYEASPDSYDQSIVIGTGLGSVLAPLYIAGRQDGSLPLTSALINSENGSTGAIANSAVTAAKDAFLYPRPFLPSTTDAVAGSCPTDPAKNNGAALYDVRVGQAWADADGNLLIDRLTTQTDTTREYTPSGTPTLDPDYDGLCTAGGFPSGHSTTAFEAGLTLATLLPELGPEILTRASEQANDRMVLGVHSPLDIMSGRMSGHIALAAVWSDADFVQSTVAPAMAELRAYLEKECGDTIAACYAAGSAYSDDPYGGAVMPGGSAQIVTDRMSALAVYAERMTYAFPTSGATGLAPGVPAGAENLLLTTFPTLTDAQRVSVIAQTEIASGAPLDLSGTGVAAWQRLDLAAAMSATVQLNADGSATVVSTGGTATVLPAPTPVTPANVPAPELAATGFADATSWLMVGCGWVLAGALVLLAARRRGRSSEKTPR